jgi:hypothetical protein
MQSQENGVLEGSENCRSASAERPADHFRAGGAVTEVRNTTTDTGVALPPIAYLDIPPDGGRNAWLCGQITLGLIRLSRVGSC